MTIHSDTPCQRRAVEFPAVPSGAGQACRRAAAQLRHWRLPQLADAVGAGVRRLLADVGRHAGAERRCTVEVLLLWDRIVVSVRDHGQRAHQAPALAAVRGGGGVRAHQDERGRIVWCTLPVPYPPAPPEAHAVRHPWAAHA
ncbi:ATP-binding protein [Streptomyces litchfieldiae]|uniref:ATP-binding protein n=1 Tax=Streptomyces litchfieldiae TaxID=3075543 RepID=A0ABU2MQY8_9ACTN|nr:ATP-binding protein [Streptomyces sp. DSM 44938]MDT0343768.1 ATP-binding protein [Streptomyces sp. DSM 44938]